MKNHRLKHLLFLLFLLFQLPAFAQGIKGTVKSNSGEPLPFASIYLPDLQLGSSTNANGYFEIKLPAGKHTIIINFIGYKTQQVQVQVGQDWVEQDFVLQEQGYLLNEVVIKSRDEDPAYTIMRKAIAKSKYHKLQYNSYQVRVYIKGTGELTDVPFFLERKLKKEGVPLDEAFTTESVSIIKFQQPNKIEEKVVSIRTSGESKNSPSPMSYVNASFYNKEVSGAVSPLAPSAFAYYRFRYEGSFKEGDITVNKIKVTPRSKGEDVFNGHIYIIDDLWAIHSLDLSTHISGFPVKVKQNYAEVAPNLWMPVTHRYHFSGKILGFGGQYQYLASCSDYTVELNQDLLPQTEIIDEKIEEVPDEVADLKPTKTAEPTETLAQEDKLTRKQFRKMINEYEKEALKKKKEPEVVRERNRIIDSLATKRDSAYWAQTRPVPLTLKEVKGYQRDDSAAVYKAARLAGKDTLGLTNKRKIKVTDFLTGGYYSFSTNTHIRLYPTLAQTYYNTVEGINVNMSANFSHEYDSLRRTTNITPTIRYGFSSKDFYGKARFENKYSYNNKLRNLYLEGGNFVEQFNPNDPIHPHINTLSTLLFRKNYMKIYEKLYATGGYTYSPSSLFSISGNLEWARRNMLFNHINYSFFYSDTREFSPSIPENIELDQAAFPQHEAVTFQADLTFRPGIKYSVYNGNKMPLLDSTPELQLSYRKGISGVLGSDVDFDQIQLGVKHGFEFGVSGKLNFNLRGGTFLNNKSMYFMDYQHFDGNRTILSSISPTDSYKLLDYYRYSTNNSYFSGLVHYQFRKFLITQLPEVRFSGIKENIFVNYLKTSHSPHYYEVGYSLDNIFKILRFDVAVSFEDGNYQELGFRIGVASFLNLVSIN